MPTRKGYYYTTFTFRFLFKQLPVRNRTMKNNTFLLSTSIIAALLSATYVGKINFKNNACTDYWAYPIWFLSWKCYYNPEVAAEAHQLISRYGFRFETHDVVTSDDYILTMYRILPKRPTNKAPIYVQHGISSNSNLFISNQNNSIAFNFVNEGHEVWLGNYRGVYNSQKHKRLTVHDKEYWDFSLRTLTTIDVREQLLYVANMTQKNGSIIYMGHSLSTGLFYSYASQYPEEAKSLVQGSLMLAAGGYIKNLPLFMNANFLTRLYMKFFRLFGYNGFFYDKPMKEWSFSIMCRFAPWLCTTIMEICAGKSTNIRPDDLMTIFHLSGDGTSYDVMEEMFQIAEHGRSESLDYGEETNLIKYGQKRPPPYNYSFMEIPTFMFYGDHDGLVTEENLERAYNEFGTRKKLTFRLPNFNHIDFFFGEAGGRFFHQELLPVLNEHFKTCDN